MIVWTKWLMSSADLSVVHFLLEAAMLGLPVTLSIAVHPILRYFHFYQTVGQILQLLEFGCYWVITEPRCHFLSFASLWSLTHAASESRNCISRSMVFRPSSNLISLKRWQRHLGVNHSFIFPFIHGQRVSNDRLPLSLSSENTVVPFCLPCKVWPLVSKHSFRKNPLWGSAEELCIMPPLMDCSNAS